MTYRVVDNDVEPLRNFDIDDYRSRKGRDDFEPYYSDPYPGYKGVVWTPLDLPKVELDQDLLWDVWSTVSSQGKIDGDEVVAHQWFDIDPELMNGQKNHDYRAFNFYKNNSYYDHSVQGIPYDACIKYFPECVSWLESLPYKNIYWCAFVGRDDDGVAPHYDEPPEHRHHNLPNEPSQVRCRWSRVTDWQREHFYLTKDHGQTRVYPSLPQDTTSMAYDGSIHEHGADKGFHPKDRIQLMPMGVLDTQKWHELLERSIQKYKDYVITVDHFA